jgi:hypothetical protein
MIRYRTCTSCHYGLLLCKEEVCTYLDRDASYEICFLLLSIEVWESNLGLSDLDWAKKFGLQDNKVLKPDGILSKEEKKHIEKARKAHHKKLKEFKRKLSLHQMEEKK